ncbi:hypothetical protein MVES1_001014 [Malassezia vespertilionis]|uniref:RPA43 OB domain-containing protein n=1 Tax=Malassezia vespertilionis TaxID=2020962 RepID=A0A2N1JFG4_9BASI|nr:uncharacterized protein MVES1_001014 [Malassezia vespertilionis]PKI85304.1 hypothetical protein MVES_000951 [Malassezia vespertilionis]WFD05682.1 hypothetical protein MVES1_001014 [Malassezia vespertilionis]
MAKEWQREGAVEGVLSGLAKISATMNLAIPPVWMGDAGASMMDQLDTLVMRYIPQLEGVLITHSDAHFKSALGEIYGDSAFAEAPVAFRALVWRPEIGMMLEGVITLSSPSHVSLLLHDTFNAAISAEHLPVGEWEFAYYEEGAVQRSDPNDRSLGLWRHKKTGSPLGGNEHKLLFTVISMTVANRMLSLHGSLLKDPFSVAPPRPGSLSFDQALAEAEHVEEPEEAVEVTHEESMFLAEPAPRKVRWDDSDATSEEEDKAAADRSEEVEIEDDAEDSDEDQDSYDEPVVDTDEMSSDEETLPVINETGTTTEETLQMQDDINVTKAEKKRKKDRKEKKGKKEKRDKKEEKSHKEKNKPGASRSSKRSAKEEYEKPKKKKRTNA